MQQLQMPSWLWKKLKIICYDYIWIWSKNKVEIYNLETLRTYRFRDWDLNKFVLLLRKGVYPYEYIDNWSKFKKASLLKKENLYGSLNLENISNSDYECARKALNIFSMENIGNCYDLYVQSDTLPDSSICQIVTG